MEPFFLFNESKIVVNNDRVSHDDEIFEKSKLFYSGEDFVLNNGRQ